jgi:hypothetical protein
MCARVAKAIEWIREKQDERRGSWQECPQNAGGGTVVHTALALNALLSAGISAEDDQVKKGLQYIQRYWEPENRRMQERFEVRVGQTEAPKQAIDHDIDCEVLPVLLATRPAWATKRILYALNMMLTTMLSTFERKQPTTVWELVPRAMLIADFLERLPLCARTGRVAACEDIVLFLTDGVQFAAVKKRLRPLLNKRVSGARRARQARPRSRARRESRPSRMPGRRRIGVGAIT